MRRRPYRSRADAPRVPQIPFARREQPVRVATILRTRHLRTAIPNVASVCGSAPNGRFPYKQRVFSRIFANRNEKDIFTVINYDCESGRILPARTVKGHPGNAAMHVKGSGGTKESRDAEGDWA